MLKGRKLLSYILNDPFGESCLIAGGYFANSSGNSEIVYPLILTGIYHTTRMAINRRRLINHIKEYGLSNRIMEDFSKVSWCSNQVARAHAIGAERYSEFKGIFKEYNTKYYIKKEIKDATKSIKSFFKK